MLIYIHGGGWTGGTKKGGFNKVLPYLEMGWNVVNVEYRLERVSQAPGAVEDCLCAAVGNGEREAASYRCEPGWL